ncbi:MAG TPA: amidohydrolase family protein, partial [Acidobacteriota bacterium]|nr:amidohydrolase family protein [Acidobacteriota bacterium]
QTVIVSGPPVNRIVWVGDTGNAPAPPNTTVVDGAGKYLSPGLVDMHIHSSTADGWLLNLANGVTTVRDMDGYPWLLQVRDHVNAGRMLAPVLYVAGTIINAVPLQGYAVVPANSEDARRIVRQQAACGYDFIKIHNMLPEPIFDAIADQARRLGMDLIGHVPHDITLDHALHAGGMRTTEHLKGFIIDKTLQVSDEDFGKALQGTETWLTPTLYTRLGYDRADAARGVLNGAAAKYVPIRKRDQWTDLLQAPAASPERVQNDRNGALLRDSQNKVMKMLLPLHPHWLAGTDAAGYPFNIMGYALLDELQLLQDAGLSPAETVRAATTEPARAMRQPAEFGSIQRQMRADLVLLDSNPLESPSAYRMNQGVMAHGVWLARERIDAAMQKLAAIDSEPDSAVVISRVKSTDLLARAKSLSNRGYVFEPEAWIVAAAAVRTSGFADIADQLEKLADIPTDGPCALATPKE